MLQPGDVLADRYELEAPIGHGGMATVYSGRDRLLGRPVAVKVISSQQVHGSDGLRRLRREAHATAVLSHPNVVAVYDAVVDGDGGHGIVMELLPGETLADIRAHRGRLEVPDAVAYGDAIAAGLGAAHAAGLVHRDVKPGNMLIDRDGTLKIADFGIARAIDATVSAGSMHGSVPYAAPEQLRGATTDGRCDLYALGCVLFELLVGRPPFAGANVADVITGHLEITPPSVRALRPDVPTALDRLVAQLLAKRPEDRPADADSVRRVLRAVAYERTRNLSEDVLVGAAANPPFDGRDPDGWYEHAAGPLSVRERLGAGPLARTAAGATIVVLAVLAIAAAEGAIGPEPDPPEATLHAEALEGDPEPADADAPPTLPTEAPASPEASPGGDSGDVVAAAAPGTVTQVADAMRADIAAARDAGQVTEEAARTLEQEIADLVAHADGHGRDAERKLESLRDRLDKLHDAGHVSAPLEERLTQYLEAFEDVHADAAEDEDGPGNGRGRDGGD